MKQVPPLISSIRTRDLTFKGAARRPCMQKKKKERKGKKKIDQRESCATSKEGKLLRGRLTALTVFTARYNFYGDWL